MSECTDAERRLIDAAMKAACDLDVVKSESLSQLGQMGCGSYPVLPDELRKAAVAVALERITPEHKERLREIYASEALLTRERDQIARGIPPSVWKGLVDEVYPRDSK